MTRIEGLAKYLTSILEKEFKKIKPVINANMLSKDINSFSLDKIPTASTIETWVNGTEIHHDVYSLRSRSKYSIDVMNNLKNIGFFEKFEALIKDKNEKGELPEIENIESIECLNCGTLNNVQTNTAEFDIQIEITYRI